jgi:hypothetical protein
MFLIDRETNRVRPLERRTFAELGFRERTHLQEWIANDPSVLGEELLIIQKEFAGFSDTSERLDLLALDKQGNLVVIENKLDDSGRDVTWQALKYASYCSSLSKEQIRSIFQDYIESSAAGGSAEDRLCEFFGGQDYEELELNTGLSQRVVLIAANFRKEVTSTVLWLLNHKVRMQCFRVTPYSMGDQLLMNAEQIIPVRDAEEYVIRMAHKTQDEAEAQSSRQRRRNFRHDFWTFVLERMNQKSELFQNISPGSYPWIGTGSGIGSIGYNLVATRSYCRAELYLNRSQDENNLLFQAMYARRDEIETAFGGLLGWDPMDGKQASRITSAHAGNIYETDQWPIMAEAMTDAMVRLEKATRPVLMEEAKRLLRIR